MKIRKCVSTVLFSILLSQTVNVPAYGTVTEITKFGYSGPIEMPCVKIGDMTAIDKSPLEYPIGDDQEIFVKEIQSGVPVDSCKENALHLYTFTIENRIFTPATIKIEGAESRSLTIDGEKQANDQLKLVPGTHKAVLTVLAKPGETPAVKVSIETPDGKDVTVRDDHRRLITLDDVMYGTRISYAAISPKGEYIIVKYYDQQRDGKGHSYSRVFNRGKGSLVATVEGSTYWMPFSEEYVLERKSYESGRHIVAVNPQTGAERVLATHLPDGYYMISPDEKFLIFDLVRKGPEQGGDVYRTIEPEDRHPGWRDRHYPGILSMEGGVLRPLMVCAQDVYTMDISPDSKRLLLNLTSRHITERPTTRYTLVSLDLTTMQTDTIVDTDGFIASAAFTADGKGVVVSGSPEAFGRVGCTLDADRVPSMYDYQLFLVDCDTKDVKPLTRDFDPSVNQFTVSTHDGKVYFTATERDKFTMYTLDLNSGKITPIAAAENVVMGLSPAASSPYAVWWGQGDSTPDAVYVLNTRKGTSTLVDRPAEKSLQDVDLARCTEWTFTNSRGESVDCLYFVPDDFDPAKTYPLIVTYYGGCNPSTRYFYSRYPNHLYASSEYVVLQITPSGATGYGQEWSSRHVSTAGKGVAEDIIEGTEQFCKEMPYVDKTKIGCIGASYGGFMTQYLLTVTDIFTAAVSHAGISDHTSYWGEGYWGYSYSETCMGNDKPWSSTDLYVNQSPIYNADKIHTPILFLHGDADTNVPVGESIQMFTALKLLGVDTEFVQVRGENHYINNPEKRRMWQNTIFAWFDKYLRGDSGWWDEMYPPVNL